MRLIQTPICGQLQHVQPRRRLLPRASWLPLTLLSPPPLAPREQLAPPLPSLSSHALSPLTLCLGPHSQI
eukprot:3396267-Rhodomonas_salina.2